MSDQTLDDGFGEDVELEARPKTGGMSGKKVTLFVVLPLLLLGGVAGGLYASGMLDKLLGEADASTQAAAPKQTVFYDMPTLLVNLNSDGRQSSFLKLTVSLELNSKQDRKVMETMQPRIVDNFQVYLRELRIEDLQGSAGLQRLREELLLRVNTAVEDATVEDVLFKQMLVQ
jgi:flagellar FliL protein